MRRKDLRGAKEWRGAWLLIASRMTARFCVVKVSGVLRFVIRSVFEGGVGCESAGRSDRSRERLERRRLVPEEVEDVGESGGDATSVAMAV